MTPDYYFPLFEDILHGTLNPLLPVNVESYGYVQKLQEMIVVTAKDTGIYFIQYLKPPTLKARYYQQKILSETFLYIADMQEYLASETNLQIRSYLRDQILDKHLTTCLMRLGEKIQKEKLQLKDLIEPSADADNNRLSNIYIFHLLRVCLTKAYLEIQELLHEVLAYKQTEEWLYTSLAGQITPVRLFLKKHEKTQKPAKVSNSTNQPTNQPSTIPAFCRANYYSSKEAYEELGISESTFLRRKKESDFPKAMKHGNKDLYLKLEKEEWKVINQEISTRIGTKDGIYSIFKCY